MEPFSTKFNVAVLRMAEIACPAGFDVATDDSVPITLAELQDQITKHGRIPVDGNNSENTIFGDPEINYAFRAWHDWTHWIIGAEFTLDGELAVANRQCEDLRRVFGHSGESDVFCRYIMTEVYGQARYFAKYDCFPTDQRQFTRDYLAGNMPYQGKDHWGR